MKELKQFLYVFMMIVATLLVGCTKEGPQGESGKDGIDGIDGENGADGTAGCIQCHKEDNEIFLKASQFDHSTHYLGGKEHVGYANYAGGSCSMCHSHQGFKAAVEAGTNFGGIHTEANPMSCYTCHQIHKNYDRTDYDFNYSDAVDLLLNETDPFTDLEINIAEYGGEKFTSNLCAKCHQPRSRGDDQPDPTKADTETITISAGAAAHWGPHYGTQGAIFSGMGGYIGISEPTKPQDEGHHSCVACHVGFVSLTGNYGDYVGGHAMNLDHSDGSTETAACVKCHTDRGASIDIDGIMASTEAYLETLETALVDAGIMDETGHLIGGTYTHKQLAAYWNYALLHYDGSHGVHNQAYSLALITSALEYLGAN